MKQIQFKKVFNHIDSLIQNTLFKLKDKINNFFNKNSKISNLNKFLITFIALLFFYLFYLLIPTLYDKTWVQKNIEKKLLKEFNINFSTSSEILYRILPTPHFLVKDSKIFKEDSEKTTPLAEIKNLKVFISQKKFLDKEKMTIKKVLINKANFSLSKKDYNILKNTSDKKFSHKKIRINNSNIFVKDNTNETIAIIKVFKSYLFYDRIKSLNLFNLEGEIFKIPFNLDMENRLNSSTQKKIIFKSKKLKLNILNNTNKKNENLTIGSSIISILNSKIYTQYDVVDDLIFFNSDSSKIKGTNLEYKGILSFNPFDLSIDVDLKNYSLFRLLSTDSIMSELIKNKLLFNQNISVNSSINLKTGSKEEIFNLAKINFNIISGKINLDKTKLINKKIGLLELDNSDLFFEEGKLILNSDVSIDIQNTDNLYSFLQTSKKYRKPLQKIFINFDYIFLTNQIIINNLKIDNIKVDDKSLNIIDEFNNLSGNNLNKSRFILNKFFAAYAG